MMENGERKNTFETPVGEKSVFVFSYLAQRLIKLLQDALFIKHLALVPVLVVVVDFLSEVGGQFVE